MVKQYQRVYHATDYYLVGGKEMGNVLRSHLVLLNHKCCHLVSPRLTHYLKFNLKAEQERLKNFIIFIKR